MNLRTCQSFFRSNEDFLFLIYEKKKKSQKRQINRKSLDMKDLLTIFSLTDAKKNIKIKQEVQTLYRRV